MERSIAVPSGAIRLIVRSASKVCVSDKETVTSRIRPLKPDTVSGEFCVRLSAIGSGVTLLKAVPTVPACETVTTWPPWIMMVPLRAGPGLAATV